MSTTSLTAKQQQRQNIRSRDGKYAETAHAEADIDLGVIEDPDVYMPSGEWPKDDYENPTARARAMLDGLADAVAESVEKGELANFMSQLTRDGLHRWSFNNRALALMQLAARRRREGLPGLPSDPREIQFNTFKQWRDLGRKPRKGEEAMYILRPVVVQKKDEDGQPTEDDDGNVQTFTLFKPYPVFNITQTDGPPLPPPPEKSPIVREDGWVDPVAIEGLKRRIKGSGYVLEEKTIPDYNPDTGLGTAGYTQPEQVGLAGVKRHAQVVIDSRLNDREKLNVMAHELGHIKCGHIEKLAEYKQHRGQMETEAEMTAYLVARDLGLKAHETESQSAVYISSWSKGDGTLTRQAMSNAMKAHASIMDGPWGENEGDNDD